MNKSLVVLGLILSIMLLNFQTFAETKVNGETIYNDKCALCHTEGKLGAPKLGDKQAWSPRLKKGLDVLIGFVINDDTHPHCRHCGTREVIEAVKFMANNSHTGQNYTLW